MHTVLKQYESVLAAAPPAALRDAGRRRFGSFNVDVLILLPGEWPLRAEMFSGAATGAQLWLEELADLWREPGELYDNLDQGWALQIVSTTDAVYTMEWNWEEPQPQQDRRILRFDRLRLAEEAMWAEARLRALHARLIEHFGEDLWNCGDAAVSKRPDILSRRSKSAG